jgi:hypothetical protein
VCTWRLIWGSPVELAVFLALVGIALLSFGRRLGAVLLGLGLVPVAGTTRLSVTADGDGLRVANPFRSYRIPWPAVRQIASVERTPRTGRMRPSYVEVRRGGTWALPDGYGLTPAVTAGLDAAERAAVVDALLAEASAAGFTPETFAGS